MTGAAVGSVARRRIGNQRRRAERHASQITRAKRQAATSSSVVVGCSAGTRNPVDERGAGQDVGDELVAVEAPPAFLGGLEQLEHHAEGGA
jgi:hypothetical protein